MKVCMFGSGGVGGYFGARLVQAGVDVTFVARGKHRSTMLNSGLRVSGISGDLHLQSVTVVEDPKENGPYDLVFLAVKAWQVEDAAKKLIGTLSDSASVVPLQNGVEAPEQLAQLLGEEKSLIGLCGIVSFLKEPGQIFHAGLDPFIQIGELDGTSGKRVDNIIALLNSAAGLTATAPEDVRVSHWLKFIFIVTMSGIGSVTRAPIGITREDTEIRKLMEECANEVYSVGCAHGIALPSDAVERTMNTIDSAPAEATASMQRDIMADKPSELYSQNAAVVRLGKSVNVDTPVNKFISTALVPLENRARGLLEF